MGERGGGICGRKVIGLGKSLGIFPDTEEHLGMGGREGQPVLCRGIEEERGETAANRNRR